MAHVSRSRFQSRGQSNAPRRRSTWSQGPNGASGTIAVDSSTIFPVGAISILNDLTLVRTRGLLSLQLLTATAAESGFRWAFGMCNVTENAAGIGVTAVPDPLVDVAWDGWFVYETGHLISSDASPVTDPSPLTTALVPIDSKAMRKTHQTDVIVAVIGVVEIGTATMVGFLASRILDKLA